MCGGGRLLDVTIMTGNFKNNLFVLTALQGGLREAVQVFLSPKFAEKSDFTYNPPFWYQSDTTQCAHNNCIISYGIVLLASASGLYLARHLSTLWYE